MADATGSAVRQLTVLGDAPGGVAVRLAVTVLINDAVLQRRTASGVAPEQQIAAADVVLEKRTSAGVATGGTAAIGEAEFERRTAFGAGPDVPIIVLERRNATGTALNGSVATGNVTLRLRSVSALSIGEGMAIGTVRLQPRIAAAVVLNAGTAVGAVALARRQVQGSSLSGSIGEAGVSLQRRTATGASATAALSVGAVKRSIFATGEGDNVLAETYRTWVMNVQNEALTEYTNHAFNSYAKFNNKTYAAGLSGLFEMSGDTDVAATIPWVLRTGFHDDTNLYQKRLHELLMSIRYDAPVRVRVWTDELTYYDYTLANFRDTLQQVRVKTGKGLQSKYYRIELAGMGGTNFEIDSLIMPVMPVSRRIG